MDRSAVLLNDSAKNIFTYTALMPYLNMAIDEIQEIMQQHNVSMSNEVSAVIQLDAGETVLSNAHYPADLVEIREVLERDRGAADTDWAPVQKVTFLPEGARPTNNLRYWTWQDQELRFVEALANKDIKINYISRAQPAITNSSNMISLINGTSFLAYRTAGLAAEFIGENPTRAAQLNNFASIALDRMLSINIKANQGLVTRRRPFMLGYKRRGL